MFSTRQIVSWNVEKDGEMDARVSLNEIRYFYQKCRSYLDVYCDAYEGLTPHLWMNMSKGLSWLLLCGSAKKTNCMFSKKITDTDSQFDEHVLVKNCMSESERRKRRQKTTIFLEQKWTQLFRDFIDKNIIIPNY